MRACRAAGFEPRLASITRDQLAIRALVARGLAVTLVPSLLADVFRDLPLRPLAGASPERDVYALLPPGGRHPLAGRGARRAGRSRRGPARYRFRLTSNAPRMNGCTRQKYVYVPAFRRFGVVHVSRLAAAVKPRGPKPSVPESKSTSPSASG